MKKSVPILLIICAVLLMCAVFVYRGQTHGAKGYVKQFMDKEMNLKDYDIIAWSNVDSTYHVSDSMLHVMHVSAVKDKKVKRQTQYIPRTSKLNLISVRYKLGNDTLMNTFYLDDKLTGIVGVK